MIYIHGTGIHNTIPKKGQPDLNVELKALTQKQFRRIDHFIQLALIGAHKAVWKRDISAQTALYIASGHGNISVFQRVRDQRGIEKQPPKPVDFINLLSNSAGFYVAHNLGLSGKNLFLSHQAFVVQMTMLLALNDLSSSLQEKALVGGVDEYLQNPAFSRKVSGLLRHTRLGEGSNWMLLGRKSEGAIGGFDMMPKAVRKRELNEFLAEAEEGTYVAFSSRLVPSEAKSLLNRHEQLKRYDYEESCGYYETLPLYVLNRFITEKTGRLIHVDLYEECYMVMTVRNDQL